MIKLFLSKKTVSQIKYLMTKEPFLQNRIVQTLDLLRRNPKHYRLSVINMRNQEIFNCYFAERFCLTYYRKHANIYLLDLYRTTPVESYKNRHPSRGSGNKAVFMR